MGGGVNSLVGVLAVAVKCDDGLAEGVVGVLRLQQGHAIVSYGRCRDDRGCPGRFELLRVLRIGQEAQLPRSGIFSAAAELTTSSPSPTSSADLFCQVSEF